MVETKKAVLIVKSLSKNRHNVFHRVRLKDNETAATYSRSGFFWNNSGKKIS
jgi:hypothetical protein